MKPLNRRSFSISMAGGAAMALSASRILGANDQIRVGIIGAGGRGSGVWRDFLAQPDVTPVAVCDVYEPNRERAAVVGNIGTLELAPESELAACALDVRYVFYGSKVTEWETRHWPALAELQRSSTLEQVFASGSAVVFRTRLPCYDD